MEDKLLLDIALPKWPGLLVKGESVTKEQAEDILLRTDMHFPDFQWAGNDHNHREDLQKIVGESFEKRDGEDYKDSYERLQAFKEKVGKIDLSYLENDRIVSSWIGGPKGWCDWDGTIKCNNFNVGKWPSVGAVLNDWIKIAEAFPYLSLRSQLLSGVTGDEEAKPVVEFVVREGFVQIKEPEE